MKKQIPLRVDQESYELIKANAKNSGKSINKFISEKLLNDNQPGNINLTQINNYYNTTNKYYASDKRGEFQDEVILE